MLLDGAARLVCISRNAVLAGCVKTVFMNFSEFPVGVEGDFVGSNLARLAPPRNIEFRGVP
jgi:hypothetical protein